MKKLEWALQLPYSVCDFTGCWKPSAILEVMQEAAGAHSHELHCGREILMEKGLVWVLTRIEVKMNRYPVAEEEILITTFPKENRRWFFPRYFTFSAPSGEVLGHASTIWALLDIQSRKMAPPDAVLPLMPDNRDIEAPMGLPSPTKLLPDEGLRTLTYRPLYEDIDVNLHVNNTRYMEWFCNILGTDAFKSQVMASFCVNYDAEITPQEELTIELRSQGNEGSLLGKSKEKKHFEISAFFRERTEKEYKK